MAHPFIKKRVVGFLWKRASKVLRRDEPYIIAVTGSVGKTTTKDAITTLLSGEKTPVRSASGNLNTEFGVPLAIMGFSGAPHGAFAWMGALCKALFARSAGPKGYRLVLEFSSDADGDIAFLAQRVPVQIAVFTRFTMSHGRSNEQVAREKLSLLEGVVHGGVVIVNADDPLQKPVRSAANVRTYGMATGADVRYSVSQYDTAGIVMGVRTKKHTETITTQLVAEHQLMSVAAAVAVAGQLKIAWSSIVARVADITPPKGRMRIIEGRKQTTIIDDSYNSSPAAAELALASLVAFAQDRRSVAVLGNMNELGDHTVSAHIALGQAVAKSGVNYLIAVGQNATRIVRGAREGGMPDQHMITFKTPEKLMARLDNLIQAKDVILVKASQNGMRFERVVKQLMAHPNEASNVLVRQDY